MKPAPTRPRARRPYKAPKLTKVEVRVDEALLGTCKTAGATGQDLKHDCGGVTPCVDFGS